MGLIGRCGAHWPAEPTGSQKTFVTPQGQSLTFTLWSAERVWKLPFFDGDSKYVRFGDKQFRLHDGAFAYGVGGILVSPDRSQIIFERAFEGGRTSGVLVDMTTREVREWDVFSGNPKVVGWAREHWRTSLEALPRDELLRRLSSRNLGAVRLAMDELGARGFEEADWTVMATVFADRVAPVDVRRYLGHALVHEREDQAEAWRRKAYFGSTTMPATADRSVPFDHDPVRLEWSDAIVQLISSTLNDPRPEIREEAQHILSSMRPDLATEREKD
jgi:hypothetical protein